MVKQLLKLAIFTGAVWIAFQGYRQYQRGLPPREMAEFAMWREDYNAALRHLLVVRQQSPKDEFVMLQIAECYDKLGDPHSAAAIYRRHSRYMDDRENGAKKRYHRERYIALQQAGF